MFNKIKELIQYKKNGYSDHDMMNLDMYFQETISKMILDLEENKWSYPMGEFPEVNNFDIRWVNENYKEIIERYKKRDYTFEDGIYDESIRYSLILRRIAYCLRESSEEFCSYKNKYDKDWERVWDAASLADKKDLDKIFKSKEYKEIEDKLRDEEWKIYEYRTEMKNEAFDLMKEYFYSLSF